MTPSPPIPPMNPDEADEQTMVAHVDAMKTAAQLETAAQKKMREDVDKLQQQVKEMRTPFTMEPWSVLSTNVLKPPGVPVTPQTGWKQGSTWDLAASRHEANTWVGMDHAITKRQVIVDLEPSSAQQAHDRWMQMKGLMPYATLIALCGTHWPYNAVNRATHWKGVTPAYLRDEQNVFVFWHRYVAEQPLKFQRIDEAAIWDMLVDCFRHGRTVVFTSGMEEWYQTPGYAPAFKAEIDAYAAANGTTWRQECNREAQYVIDTMKRAHEGLSQLPPLRPTVTVPPVIPPVDPPPTTDWPTPPNPSTITTWPLSFNPAVQVCAAMNGVEDFRIDWASIDVSDRIGGVVIEGGGGRRGIIRGVKGNFRRFGIYADGATSDLLIEDCECTVNELPLPAPPSFHSNKERPLRLHIDGRCIVRNSKWIQDQLVAGDVDKSAAWFVRGTEYAIQGNEFQGEVRFGARPNDNQGITVVKTVDFDTNTISTVPGGDNEAIQIWNGCDNIVMSELDITCDVGNWLSLETSDAPDGYVRARNIRWDPATIKVNGQTLKERGDSWYGVRGANDPAKRAAMVTAGCGPIGE